VEEETKRKKNLSKKLRENCVVKLKKRELQAQTKALVKKS
jgi:hypothetical protein